jgi:pimeloyl-ACP methyl ester carboxylesterase
LKYLNRYQLVVPFENILPKMSQELAHLELNDSCSTTILFIHGAFSSHREWIPVSGHLSDYHLLIPSLPSHGFNLKIRPFSLELSAHLLADLIRQKAKNGKAHIVGLSMGAHVAIYLASHYPDVVNTVFASGFNRFSPSIWTPVLPYIVYVLHHLSHLAPQRVTSYLMDGMFEPPGLQQDSGAACTMSLCREVVGTIVSDAEILPAPARTLMIAATKRGLLPTNDRTEDAKMVADIMKEGNGASRAVEVRTMRHPWDLQDPELFARSVVAWIEGIALPEEISDL